MWRVDEEGEEEEEEKRKECGSTLPLYAALNSLYSTSERKKTATRNKNYFEAKKRSEKISKRAKYIFGLKY